MSTANLSTNSAPAQSYTAVNSGIDGATQTEGETLFQQASQSHQPDVLVKRKFEQSNESRKNKLANEFITSAGHEGISQLAATLDGQHALSVVYDHADNDGREMMRQVHDEQGNTAVDYTDRGQNSESTGSSDRIRLIQDRGLFSCKVTEGTSKDDHHEPTWFGHRRTVTCSYTCTHNGKTDVLDGTHSESHILKYHEKDDEGDEGDCIGSHFKEHYVDVWGGGGHFIKMREGYGSFDPRKPDDLGRQSEELHKWAESKSKE